VGADSLLGAVDFGLIVGLLVVLLDGVVVLVGVMTGVDFDALDGVFEDCAAEPLPAARNGLGS
jgi:hypothetical protein